MTILRINFTDGFSSEITPSETVISASSFLVGTGVPASGLGNDGDVYIDSASGIFYIKASGSWSVDSTLTLPASGIVNTPAGDIVATDVQAAIAELDTEKLAKAGGTITGNLTVSGDLQVDGTTTTLNTSTLDVADANITVNKGGVQATADSSKSGITVEMSDATDAIIGYDSTLTSKFKIGEVGAEVEVADISSAQVITGKDIDGGTASNTNRITIPKDDKTTLDGLTRKEGTIVYDSTGKKAYIDDGTTLQAIGSGAAGGKNYITNPQAEVDASDWTVYKNTTVSGTPDDFGGTASGNLLFTRNTTTPLSGAADFKFAKAALDVQGEGVYTPITVDKADLSRVLTGSLDLDASNANLADGDVRYYMVSSSDSFVADFNVINVNGEDLTASVVNYFRFQTESDDTEYRFCMHIATTNATAYDIYTDNFSISPQTITHGVITTDWEDFTPTASTGWGTITGAVGKKRRVGDSLEVVCSFVSGTVIAADNFVSLPLGLTIDTAKVDTAQANILGTAAVALTASGQIFGSTVGATYFASYNGANTDRIYLVTRTSSSATWNYTQTVSSLVGSGAAVQVRYTVPILGWSSNARMSEDLSARQVVVRGEGNGGTSLTADVTNIDFTSLEDTTASWNGTQFTAPENARYTIEGAVRFTASTGDSLAFYVDGSLAKLASGNNNSLIRKFSTIISLNKGEVLSLRYGASVTLFNIASGHYIHIQKLASAQTMLETETVAARYTSNNAQSITVSDGLLTYEDLVSDTHNRYVSGVYTIPTGGWYHVNASYATNGTSMGRADIKVRLNSSTIIMQGRDEGSVSTAARNPIVSQMYEFAKGDTIEILGDVSVAANMIVTSSMNVFSIARIK